MGRLSYKIRTLFQEITGFISLNYQSLKAEYRYVQSLCEIRKSYSPFLTSPFLPRFLGIFLLIITGFFFVGFIAVEGGAFLAEKAQKSFSPVQAVEANVAPQKKNVQEGVNEIRDKATAPVSVPKVEPITPVIVVKPAPEVAKKVVVLPKEPVVKAEKKPVPEVPSREVSPEERYIILVDKKQKTLRLAEFVNGKYVVIEEFYVSIGQVMGDKKFEGDLKTPEGKYKILKIKVDSQLHSQYGPFAFVLNYPNKRDKSLGKTGYGIWIHGSGSNTRSPETKGCIELGNADLVRLRNYIQVETPVYIYPSGDEIINEQRIDLAAIDSLKTHLEALDLL